MSKKSIKKKKIQRDCWDLDTAFYKWLAERLPVYLKDADKVVDLTLYTFNYHGETFTQKEMIEKLIVLVNNILTEDQWNLIRCDNCRQALEIWSMIIPCMWW